MAVKSKRMESLTMHGNMTILYLCHFGAVYLTIGGGGDVGGEVGFYVLLESYSFFLPTQIKNKIIVFYTRSDNVFNFSSSFRLRYPFLSNLTRSFLKMSF